MIPLRIGEAEVRRVVEWDRMVVDPGWILANADPETIRAAKSWLDHRFIEPDGDRLVLSMHSYVIRAPRLRVLVDSCNGNDKDRPTIPEWHRMRWPYIENLAAIGLAPEDIDIVLCTHLHADHVGWNTRLTDGRWVPTFPRARYVFARREFDHWNEAHRAGPPEPVNLGSFVDSVLPVVETGRAELVETDYGLTLGPGLQLMLRDAAGHTAGNVNIELGGGGRRVLFSGDVLHHPVQIAAPWIGSIADFDFDLARSVRARLIEDCANSDTVLLTGHFAGPTAGRVIRHRDGFRFRFFETGSDR